MELVGRRFGHIRITDVVGQGGMGDVYAGYDEKLDRKVALKVLHAYNRLDAEARERLVREARALSKLEHPNICRIHDYIESSDVDVLVLEFINGRTLQDVILDEQLPRSEKLRIAIDVAEVLVAAHRVGIVHRDLKPENVMITKQGVVKVLDFGLARWLTVSTSKRLKVSSGSMPALVPQVDQSDNLWFPMHDAANATWPRLEVVETDNERFHRTAAGVTMGTPLYMSPEQARGEELTTASDMFAFGLLMQCLFTGSEPHPPGLNVREVILRAARGETVPVNGVANDITLLINRLKNFAPADRPTAIEAVRKLRFLADKPKRIVRRSTIAAAAALVILGAWRYVVDLRFERMQAEKARAEAVMQRTEVENLLEFMLGDLRVKLERVGRLEVLDDVAERALQYIDSRRPEAMTVPDLVRNAKALNQLGDARVAQGKIPVGMSLFQRSLVLADQALKREPKNGEALMVLGATHFYLGNSQRLQGDSVAALQHMREYMRVGDTLASLDPVKKEYQLERAYGHAGVAMILEADGAAQEALEHYEISLRVKDGIARREPDDTEAQAELARAVNKVGGVMMQLGDLRGAKTHFEKELAVLRKLVARDPKNATYVHRLANCIAYLALTLWTTGEHDRAFTLWQEELAIERDLSHRDPENVSWQRSVGVTSTRLGAAHAARGEKADAMRLFSEARVAFARAIALAPARKALAVNDAGNDIEHARALAMFGEPAAARNMLRGAVERLGTFPAADRAAQFQLARAAYYLGATERAERIVRPLLPATTYPPDLDTCTRILVARNDLAEARRTISRLAQSGYDVSELNKLCSEAGC